MTWLVAYVHGREQISQKLFDAGFDKYDLLRSGVHGVVCP